MHDVIDVNRGDRRLLDAVFRPRGIALVGASADPNKISSRPQQYLRDAGYGGLVAPINPRVNEIDGLRCYPKVSDVGQPIDHAFVMVPAVGVEGVLRDCGEAGVRVATLFTAGFAEIGSQGAERQARILKIAAECGIRLIGPNCIGLIDVHNRMPLTTNAAIATQVLRPGGVSVISQSGSMLGSLLTRSSPRNVGFSKLVSIGNEADIGVGEIAQMMVDDSETEVVLLFLETFRDHEELAKASHRAFALGKKLVAYKLGRSDVGRRVAASHTGAIVGGDEAASAFLKDIGVLRADTLDGFIELPMLIRGKSPPKSRRVGIMTATGGAAAMIVDRLGQAGDEIPAPPEKLKVELAEKGIDISDSPLIDLPMGASEGGRYATVLSGLLASDHCDAVISVIGSTASSRPQILVERILCAERTDKPLAVFLAPHAEEGLRLLQEAGVAGFRTPESCADAVHAYLNWRAPVDRPTMEAPAAARDLVAKTTSWDEASATRLFEALNVPVARNTILKEHQLDDLPDLTSFGDELVLKCVSEGFPHKTEAGLVALRVAPSEVPATARILIERARKANSDSEIDGILCQSMEKGLLELMIGFRRDQEVGPVVVVATGGITAELRPSASVRIAPVSPEVAREMISEIPETRLVAGFRGLPESDLEKLAQVIVDFSKVALFEEISEAEINPIMLREGDAGPVAVDGLVVPSEKGCLK